jgi:hypothetical protein
MSVVSTLSMAASTLTLSGAAGPLASAASAAAFTLVTRVV